MMTTAANNENGEHRAGLRAHASHAADYRCVADERVGSAATGSRLELARELASEFSIYDLLRFFSLATKAPDLTTLTEATATAIRLTEGEDDQREAVHVSVPVARFDPVPVRAFD